MLMRWKLAAVLSAGALITAAMLQAADAAPRKRTTTARTSQPTVFVSRDESGRTRTRLIVTPRSYLDGGTEVLPSQRKFTDYVYPLGHRPSSALGPNVVTNPPGPIPDPFFLPGKNNPWPWFPNN
jgi:hypothetical protein